ncbi:Retrovirus-related Pol polyprotein from transposon TNT 1-94 [Sesamum angolense]|uniref:Retrovirus-related Pol polyprotein from transposon TNT 1-94 n=1 Tax=Sesamum angolense TaxID=2727404 RepID=A0AAE1WAK7_9LAMI|nr:Retrovirus-related Pol polyprotein from transposon TNT 1-94 [Sesamum angolense]
MGKGKKKMGTQQQSRANDICGQCREKGRLRRDCPKVPPKQGMFVVEVNMATNSASWILNADCGDHICNDLQVLHRSRKLSKDEVVLRLGGGKAVAAERSDWIMTAQNKCNLDNLENAQIWYVRLGQISQDRRKRLVDSKSLHIHNLGNLPGYICWPLNTQARGGFSYFITLIIHRGDDFIKNDFDPCVYKKVNGSSIAFLVLYVDDIFLIDNDVKILGDTKAWLSTQFPMNDLGEFSYLRIKIFRDRSKWMLGMTRNSYVKKVLKRKAYWTAVKTILKYLRRTKDMFLVYGGGELILEGYTDASFQSNDDNAKSQSRFVFKLNSGVVDWKSFKQDTTADSTTEVEYIVASEAVKEVVWMKNYFQELGMVPNIAEPVVIFYDNNGAISQTKQSRSHHRFKYIFRRYHLLREIVGRGDVRMDRVNSAENTTNLLIKPLSQIAHAQHLGKMGLKQISVTFSPQTKRINPRGWAAHLLAAMKPTLMDWFETFQVEDLKVEHRVSIETCTKYYSHVSSAGEVGRLCSFSGLVGKRVD